MEQTQTATKFTPGPWKVDVWQYPQRTPPETIPTICGESDAVAQTCVLWREGADSSEERMANARLIAQAPRMYEALQRIAGVELPGEPGSRPHLDGHDAEGFIRIARAALRDANPQP